MRETAVTEQGILLRLKWTARAATASAALMLSGCGSGAPSQDETGAVAKDVNAAADSGTCPLDASQVSRLIGTEVTADELTYGDGTDGGCAYLDVGTGARAAFVGWSPANEINTSPRTDTLLPGIGDAAWVSRGSASGIGKAWTATARLGDRVVTINVFGAETQDPVIAVLKAPVAKM